jgi:hypothetical protein
MTRLEKEMLALPSLTQEQLQERYLGALPFLVLRELERRASPGSSEPRKAPSLSLNPGTRLVREWNGKTIAVEVREQDFVWEDRSYRSLSQIAKEVTGAHWSGPRFFGLARGS